MMQDRAIVQLIAPQAEVKEESSFTQLIAPSERIREETERVRREKQAESLRITHDSNLFGVSDNKLTQTKQPERVNSKLAETFNTNRTYISEAAKLRETK